MAEKDFEDDYDIENEIEEDLLSEEEYQFDDSEEESSFGSDNEQDFSLLEDENFEDDDDDFLEEGENPLEQFINRLKNEEPKKLALMAGGALFALFAIIFAGMQLFGGSSTKPQPVPATKAMPPANTPIATPTPEKAINTQVSTTSQQSVPLPPQESAKPLENNTVSPIAAIPATQGTTLPAEGIQNPSTAPTANTNPLLGVPSSTNPILTNPVPPTTVPVTPVVSTPTPTLSSDITTTLNDRLTKLEQQQDDVTQKLSALEKQGDNSTTEMSTLSQGVNNIENQVMELNNLLTKLTATAKTPTKRPPPERISAEEISEEISEGTTENYTKPVKKSHSHSKASHSKEMLAYYVQAIVPGRAWLKDSNGKITTVAIGDPVAGYGTVVGIDARNGVVSTSNGTKIEYGIDQF